MQPLADRYCSNCHNLGETFPGVTCARCKGSGVVNPESDYIVETVNYSGHVFSDFYVDRAHGRGPGWFVWGRNSEKYGTHENGKGAYVMLCARPDRPYRRHVHFNCAVPHGWRRKRDAQAIADKLNGV